MNLQDVPLSYDSKTDTYHGELSDLNLRGMSHPLQCYVPGEESGFLFKYTRQAEGEGDSRVSDAYVYKNGYGATLILTF